MDAFNLCDFPIMVRNKKTRIKNKQKCKKLDDYVSSQTLVAVASLALTDLYKVFFN